MAVDPVEQIWTELFDSLDRLWDQARLADSQFTGLLDYLRGYRRAKNEPWPLCIDGHEYRRRQRRRVKRKR